MEVKSIARELNLRSHLAKLQEVYTFEQPTASATVCFPAAHFAAAAYMAFVTDDAQQGLEYAVIEAPGQPDDATCVSVAVRPPSAVLTARLIAAHQQVPRPASVTQTGTQRVTFDGTIQAPSPYAVPSQALTVLLPSTELHAHSRPGAPGARVRAEGSKVEYSNLGATAPFAVERLHLHYKNHKPFLRLLSVDRHITVSHWGRVYIEEKYRARHSGAVFTGPFSRWAVTTAAFTRQDSAHITGLTATLPAAASYVYVTDQIGHVLTSGVRKAAGKRGGGPVKVDLVPRFPLFGGWEVEFTLGYSLPLAAAVSRRAGAHYVAFQAAPPLDEDYIADVITTRVTVPEGSSDVRVHPAGLDLAVADATTYTYLDTRFVGRPTRIITLKNGTNAHLNAAPTVSYTFNPLYALLEPALLIGALICVFAIVIAVSRLDLTIAKDSKWRERQCTAQVFDITLRLEAALAPLMKRAHELSSLLAAGAGAQDRASAREHARATAAAVRDGLPDVLAAEQELARVGSRRAAVVTQLHAALGRLVADVDNLVASAPAPAAPGASGAAGKSKGHKGRGGGAAEAVEAALEEVEVLRMQALEGV